MGVVSVAVTFDAGRTSGRNALCLVVNAVVELDYTVRKELILNYHYIIILLLRSQHLMTSIVQ